MKYKPNKILVCFAFTFGNTLKYCGMLLHLYSDAHKKYSSFVFHSYFQTSEEEGVKPTNLHKEVS